MRCGACEHENREGQRFCAQCGGSLASACSQCGATLEAGDNFCGSCGASLGAASAEAPVAATRAPSSFAAGRYQVKRPLGEGAKKRVYLAHDTRLDRDVALALIKTEGIDEAGRARVRREAQAMGRLGDHPRIVTVFDSGEEEGQPYIVSEYMDGGDLESQLESAPDHRLDMDAVLRVAEQLCDALQHAHSRGVVHRDVKPGNVWLSRDGNAHLGDFGLAFSVDRSRLTGEGMMVGTVAYMPPEQALGRKPDERSDLYALGATVYELLTGRPPFLGDDAVTIISQHINTPPVAPSWHNPDVSKPLESVVLRLLEKDPGRRPASASDAARMFRAATARPTSDETAETAETAGPNPLDALASGIFVGRDVQLQRLREGLDHAMSGRGRILLLVGEPGIGKTRTAEELATYASVRGAQVLWGRCYEGEGAPAYWPWVQIIRTYVHDREPRELLGEMGPGAADIAEVVSEVREQLPGLPTPPALEPDQARFRLFDSVTHFLRNASSARPIVLVLDDLHWADKPSLLLLEFLARELEPSRVLVVGSYRDVEVGRQHPLEGTLATLARSDVCDRVLLRGLTEADVARFIELTAGRAPPPALVEAVYRETEGNPFFVSEVVRLLQSDGRLDDPGSVESWSVEIPQGVRQVIGRRLNALGEACNAALGVASVIGRDFDLSVLAGAAALPEGEVLELVEEAEDARIIAPVEGAPATWRFSHALVRETLYDEIRTTRRLGLHRRVAEVLETRHADGLDAVLAQLSYHYCEAAAGGDVDKAVAYAMRAAERATASTAYEEAAAHYDRALSALEASRSPEEERRCELLLALGVAHYRSGAPEHSRAAFSRAVERARRIDAPELFARAALDDGTLRMLAATIVEEDRVALLEEALERLDRGDSALRANLLAHTAGALVWAGVQGRVRDLAKEAVAMARRVGDPIVLRSTLGIQNTVARDRSLAGRLAAEDEVLELSVKSADRLGEFDARGGRIILLMQLADRDELLAEIARHRALAPEIRQPYVLAWSARYAVCLALIEGRLTDARRELWESRNQELRIHREVAEQLFGLQLFWMRWMQGRLSEVEPGLRAGLARFPENPIWRALLAVLLAETGRSAEAREEIDVMAEGDFATIVGNVFGMHGPLFLVAEACADASYALHAPRLYELLRDTSKEMITFGGTMVPGAGARALGGLAALMGREDVAVAHFDEALETETRLGAYGLLPRTQCAAARTLLARGAEGDRRRALALLDEALDTSRELGLKGWLDRGLALKLEAQGLDSGSLSAKGTIDAIAASLGQNPPDFSNHAASDGTVTLMFSDIEGFTPMTARLGDQRAHEVVGRHNAIVREQIARHDGREVELQGDGFLLAFSDTQQALRCAVAIQRAFVEHNARYGDESVRVRIGLHTGEAIQDRGHFFGLTVILAARVASQANGGEVLVTATTLEHARDAAEFDFGEERSVSLKGISEPQRLIELHWAADDRATRSG